MMDYIITKPNVNMSALGYQWSPQSNAGVILSPQSPGNAAEDGHFKWREGCSFDRCAEFPRGRYLGQQLLGSGTYGKVVECIDQKHKASNAVKLVRRGVAGFREAAMKEIDILQDLGGLHGTVHLLRSFEHEGHICMSFDLLGPSIKSALESRSAANEVCKSQIAEIVRQLLRALAYVHGKGIIHTDLKTENILFVPASLNGGPVQVKLIDFGSAIYSSGVHNPLIGTHEYRSPEAILQAGWSYPVDIWSLGCVIAEMHCGQPLFCLCHEDLHLELMRKVLGKPIPASMLARAFANVNQYNRGLLTCDSNGNPQLQKCRTSANARIPKLEKVVTDAVVLDLLRSMFEYEPTSRITAKKALQHRFCLRVSQEEEGADTKEHPAHHDSARKNKILQPTSILSPRTNETSASILSPRGMLSGSGLDTNNYATRLQKPKNKVRFQGLVDLNEQVVHGEDSSKELIVDLHEPDNHEVDEVFDDDNDQVMELLDEADDSIVKFQNGESCLSSETRYQNTIEKSSKKFVSGQQVIVGPECEEKTSALEVQVEVSPARERSAAACGPSDDSTETPSSGALYISDFENDLQDLTIVERGAIERERLSSTENRHSEEYTPMEPSHLKKLLLGNEDEINNLREEVKQLNNRLNWTKQELCVQIQSRKEDALQADLKLDAMIQEMNAKHEAEISKLKCDIQAIRDSCRESMSKEEYATQIKELREELAHKHKLVELLGIQNTSQQAEVTKFEIVIREISAEHTKLQALVETMIPKEQYDGKVSALAGEIKNLQKRIDESVSKVDHVYQVKVHQDMLAEFVAFLELCIAGYGENGWDVLCSASDDLPRKIEKLRKIVPNLVPKKHLENAQSEGRDLVGRLQQRNLDMANRIHQLESEVERLKELHRTLLEEFDAAVEEQKLLHPVQADSVAKEQLKAAREEIGRLQNRIITMAHRITNLTQRGGES